MIYYNYFFLTFCLVDPPPGLPIVGTGFLVQARVCRKKSKGERSGEGDAISVSADLPFIEYDLHRQLMLKIRLQGHNAAFRIRKVIEIGPTMIIGVSTATSVYCLALPTPPVISIRRPIVVDSETSASEFIKVQRELEDISSVNRDYLGQLSRLYLAKSGATFGKARRFSNRR